MLLSAMATDVYDARIVDQNVQPAMLGDYLRDQSAPGAFIRNVVSVEPCYIADLIGNAATIVAIDIGDNDLCAFLREQPGIRFAQALSAAGDDHHLTFEPLGRHLPLPILAMPSRAEGASAGRLLTAGADRSLSVAL